MTNSRRKGANGEREAARVLGESLGIDITRMGRNGKTAEDIDHPIPGVWVEVKRPARLGWWRYKRQAFGDAGEKIPTVMMRPDGDTEWMLAVPVARLREFAEIVSEIKENKDD